MDKNVSKKRVAVLCGARSTEHEVSLVSAYNIANAIDRNKYEVFVVGISKDGVWKQYDPENFVINGSGVGTAKLVDTPISGRLAVTQCSNQFYDVDNHKVAFECDVIFPAVLGNYAEDGTMQGLLRMMDVPFTTPDVLGSAVGMDKDVASRLLQSYQIPVANFKTLRKNKDIYPSFDDIKSELDSDVLFVKPANAGSSVGVSKVTNEAELKSALDLAFKYDVKVMIQAGIIGREVEIAVMGQIKDGIQTSAIGEIVAKDAFYDYDSKYIHSNNVVLKAPTDIDTDTEKQIKKLAIQTCEALECEGFSRVDFLISKDNKVYVNEINTMPGFTAFSMFPNLWKVSGVPYPELVDKLLTIAFERYEYRIAPIITDASDVLNDAVNTKSEN